MKVTKKQLIRIISEALGPQYDRSGKLKSTVVSPNMTKRSLPHSYQAPNTRRSPEEYLDPEESQDVFNKIRSLRYTGNPEDSAMADELALAMGSEAPETGFFDMSKSFSDEMQTRARVEDRDEDGEIGYESILDLAPDDNIDFRMLFGSVWDKDMNSQLYKLIDGLHGVDIKRVIMHLERYLGLPGYAKDRQRVGMDILQKVDDTISSLKNDYKKKASEIFGDRT